MDDEEVRLLGRDAGMGDKAAAERLGRPLGEIFHAWEATWIVHRHHAATDHHPLGFYGSEAVAHEAGKLEEQARLASGAQAGSKEEFCHVVPTWLVQSVRGPVVVAGSSGRLIPATPRVVTCHADAVQGRRDRMRASALAKLSEEEAQALGVKP